VPLPGSRLPVETAYGYFNVDPPDAVETGNLLLVARLDTRRTVDVSETSEPQPVRVDRLRMVCYFVSALGENLDLNCWTSAPLVRFEDIEAVADEDVRTRLVVELYAAGERYAWTADAEPPAALRHLKQDGSTHPFGAGDRLPADPAGSDLRMLSRRNFAVARNGARKPIRVPMFARAREGFPHGFEVKVDGTGSGGLVAIQLAVVATKAGSAACAMAQRRVGFREE
jgi:hypothetical protein